MIVRIAHNIWRLCWFCLIVLLTLFALYLIVGRLLSLSLISDREQVEQLLKDNGLTFLALSEVESQWQVHDPRISVIGVTYGDATQPAIAIDELTIELDSIGSLIHRTPVLSEVSVKGVRFRLMQDAKGFWIDGLPRGEGELNVEPLLNLLPHLQLLQLEEVAIEFESPAVSLQIAAKANQPWIVAGEDSIKQLSMPMHVTREGGESSESAAINLRGFYEGDIREEDFLANLYFEATAVTLDGLLGATAEEKLFSSAVLDARIWLSANHDGIDASAELTLSNIDAGRSLGEIRLLDSLATEIRYAGPSFREGILSIPSVDIVGDNFTLSLGRLDAAIGLLGGIPYIAANLALLDVQAANTLVSYAGRKALLSERLGSAMAAVSPAGQLENIQFLIDLESWQPKLVGSVNNYSMKSYLGVPAVDRVNGLISLQPDLGYIDIDSEGFEMYFANMFGEPWPFDIGRGRVGYQVRPEGVAVTSGLIELRVGALDAFGKVALSLPPRREDQTWGLTLGILDADLLDASRYIPNTMSADLSDWLERSVKQGKGTESGLTFHGALFRGSPAVRKSHDLFFKVEETELEYHPDWPTIAHASATVHVNSYFVSSKGVTGRVFESDLMDAEVFIPITLGQPVDTVLVKGRALGPLSNGVRVLNETPLSDLTAQMASSWQAEGEMNAGLQIEVPIGPRNSEAIDVDVVVDLQDTMLDMPEFDIAVDKLTGQINYRSQSGLAADSITGEIFGFPVRGNLSTTSSDDSGEIMLALNGRVDAVSLYDWSDQILLSRAAGVIDYQASLHVPFGGARDEVYVEARSNLVGVTLNLPYPLNKASAESPRSFSYRQTFNEPGFRVDINWDDEVRASLKIADGFVKGGRLHFGTTPPGALAYDAIRITGVLPSLSFSDWLETTTALGELSEVSLEAEIAESVASADLRINSFDVYSLELIDVDAVVTRDDGAWLAHLRNEMLQGQVRVDDDDSEPLKISLDRLSFTGEDSEADPLEEVNPLEIGAVDFQTRQLILDGEDYGAWAFKFRESDGGARFEDLTATTMGVRIVEGSQAGWRLDDQGHQSYFHGDIEIDDLSETLTRFGLASSIEGDGLKARIETGWAGSPAALDFLKLSGDITVQEGRGRFVQADTGGALKLLGIFDFASLARRFRFDFADVVDKGFEFTDIEGSVRLDKGLVEIREPIVIRSTSGHFTMGGVMDMHAGTIDSDMIVTLPVGRTLPWYAAYSAIVTGPLAGAGVMIAQKVFENQINQMSSAKYKIGGTLEEPDIEFVSIFSDEIREVSEE